MKRTWAFSVLLLIGLTVTAYGATDDAAQTAAQVKQRVEAIYKEAYAAYTNNDEDAPFPDLNSQFCSQDWNATVNAVLEIDKKNPDEMGFFDADYWVMGQDAADKIHIKDVKVVDVSNTKATVEMTIANFEPVSATLEMVFERGNWYIDNFIDRSMDIDWKDNMKEYIKEHGASR